jgi:hypothetical protein
MVKCHIKVAVGGLSSWSFFLSNLGKVHLFDIDDIYFGESAREMGYHIIIFGYSISPADAAT